MAAGHLHGPLQPASPVTERAERLVKEGLAKLGWTEQDLASQPKAHQEKVKLARALRTQTPMTRDWIAKRLGMGSSSYVAHLLGRRGQFQQLIMV